MPMVDLMKLFNPYLPTNGGALYLCPADKPPPWNYAFTESNNWGITTNELLFADSYYYYHSFYCDDNDINTYKLQQRSASQVRSPAKKLIMGCLAEPENGQMGAKSLAHGIAHGKDGFPLLCVDGHSAYTKYTSLVSAKSALDPSLDWTVGGLKGEDLK